MALGQAPGHLARQSRFDRSFIRADSGAGNWEERPYAPLYDKAAWFENGQPAHLPTDYYSSTFIVDKALEYIAADRQDGKPFFAYLGFQANHVPVQAPKDMIDKYRGRYDQGWAHSHGPVDGCAAHGGGYPGLQQRHEQADQYLSCLARGQSHRRIPEETNTFPTHYPAREKRAGNGGIQTARVIVDVQRGQADSYRVCGDQVMIRCAICASLKPAFLRIIAVCSPRLGTDPAQDGVVEKRGAGAACNMPS